MAALAPSKLPNWDIDVFFPGLDSTQFAESFERIGSKIGELATLLDQHATAGRYSVEGFEAVLNAYNGLHDDVRLTQAYIYGKVSTNSRDDLALAKESEFEQFMVELAKLGTRVTAWFGSLDVEKLVSESALAGDHRYALEKAIVRARHLMSPSEETLAAELNVIGASAWGRLHSNMTSQMEVTVDFPDKVERMPMSAVRNLAYDADRDVRRAGYHAELAAWKAVEVPMAASMNGIKGQVNTLAKRRGWGSALEEAVFRLNIDAETLDAMISAAKDSFPTMRRYLKAKAKSLGLSGLEWYDMFAPVGAAAKVWEYEEGAEFVARQFTAFSQKMGDFSRRSYRENWVDAEPRGGKVDGAYCMPVTRDVSRILMNFKPSFGSVKTLAHELGHAYHNLCLNGRTALQRTTPSTLAETASIFCETIVKNAALKEANDDEKFSILEASLQGSCQTVVDITSRFLFEQGVFEARLKRELSASELSELMLNAQRDTYGDGLVSYHPYMWAVKPHYYSVGSYYNFPYMFGMLFGLGLYSEYEKDAESFRKGYDELLSSTGLADAATLASRFGIDIRSKAFWAASLNVVARDIEEFEKVVGSG